MRRHNVRFASGDCDCDRFASLGQTKIDDCKNEFQSRVTARSTQLARACAVPTPNRWKTLAAPAARFHLHPPPAPGWCWCTGGRVEVPVALGRFVHTDWRWRVASTDGRGQKRRDAWGQTGTEPSSSSSRCASSAPTAHSQPTLLARMAHRFLRRPVRCTLFLAGAASASALACGLWPPIPSHSLLASASFGLWTLDNSLTARERVVIPPGHVARSLGTATASTRSRSLNMSRDFSGRMWHACSTRTGLARPTGYCVYVNRALEHVHVLI